MVFYCLNMIGNINLFQITAILKGSWTNLGNAVWNFYYKTSGVFLAILATVTFTSFLTAYPITTAKKEGKKAESVFWLVVSILIDLGFLFYYKYAYFGVDVFNSLFGTHFSIVDTILLPVGISFYTFQVLSYTVDVYRGHVKPVHNFFDFGNDWSW